MKAESTADLLEKGGDQYETLYDAKLRAEERKFKKIYGNKAVSKMKGDFKRSVTDVTIMLQKKVIHQYEEAKSLLIKTEKSLQICLSDQREKIPHQQRLLEEQLASLQNKLEAFKQQLNAVIDAEKEIKR